MPTPEFAAALIAGGRSTRMGQDKARLAMPGGAELWQDRLALLKALGSTEIMISCRRDQDYLAASGAHLVFDRWENAGPLGGIVSCLEAMHAEWLLVLGVDLPSVTPGILTFLINSINSSATLSGQPSKGVVFRHGKFLEPLLAIYPKSMAATGQQRLAAGELAVKDWIAAAEQTAHMRVLDTPAEWHDRLENINHPASWERWLASRKEQGSTGLRPVSVP